jgi:hypothetical protein
MFRDFLRLAATSLALLSEAAASATESAPPGCADPQARQFDFWIGQWRVTENGKLAGHNHIERVLDGCALVENWSSAQGGSGKSLNFFDRSDGLWHQTWIDRGGGALFLSGRFADGSMRMEGERPGSDQQPPTRHRITWTSLPDGSVRQVWESTPVGKEAWNTQFDGLYVRAKTAPSAGPRVPGGSGNAPGTRTVFRICAPTRVNSQRGDELLSATSAREILRWMLHLADEGRERRLLLQSEGCATA